MSQERGEDFLEKVGYDDYDERKSEMPEMRPRMDETEAGTPSSVSELQTDQVGYTFEVVTAGEGRQS